MPIEVMLAINYEMELRDLAVTSMLEKLEELFEGIGANPLAKHFIDGLQAGQGALKENPFLLAMEDAVKEAEKKIEEACPGWAD